MSSALMPRLALRQSRWVIQRRAQSSTTEKATSAVSSGANSAKETASETAGKAQQGLSRVTSSAGNMLGSASNAATNVVSRIGGRTGALISRVQALIPPTVYYARVGGELAKIIYRGRSMQPPTMQTVQSYLTPVTNAVRNPSALMSQTQGAAQSTAQQAASNPQSFLTRLRNMDSDTLLATGIVTAETIGFFCVGEMIGRFKVIGYWGGKTEHH